MNLDLNLAKMLYSCAFSVLFPFSLHFLPPLFEEALDGNTCFSSFPS